MKQTIELIKEWYKDETGYKPDIGIAPDVNYLGNTPYLSHRADDQKAMQDIDFELFKGYGDCDIIDAEDWPAWTEGQTIDIVDVQDNDGDGIKCILEAEDGSFVWCYVGNVADFDPFQEIINEITIED